MADNIWGVWGCIFRRLHLESINTSELKIPQPGRLNLLLAARLSGHYTINKFSFFSAICSQAGIKNKAASSFKFELFSDTDKGDSDSNKTADTLLVQHQAIKYLLVEKMSNADLKPVEISKKSENLSSNFRFW